MANEDAQGVLDVAQILTEEFNAIHTKARNIGSRPSAPLEARLAELYDHVHALSEGRSALCLSGGGVRSAAFSLGVLQSLADHKVLGRFHYLSTVSGGGYIGGWLSAWIHHHFTRNKRESGSAGRGQSVVSRRSKLDGVVSTLRARPGEQVGPSTTPAKGLGGERPPEPNEVAHLRKFSRYLTPGGARSRASWTLAALYVSNLLLNWLILLPLLGSLIAVPHLLEALVSVVWIRSPATIVLGVPALAVGLIAPLSIGFALPRRGAIPDRRARIIGALLRAGFLWVLFTGAVLLGPVLLLEAPVIVNAAGATTGLATYALSKLANPLNRKDEQPQRSARIGYLLTVLQLILILFIISILSLAVDVLAGRITLAVAYAFRAPWDHVAAIVVLGGVLLGCSALFAYFLDVNEFSMHSVYRNRIVRAFLGASGGPAKGTDDAHQLELSALWPSAEDLRSGDQLAGDDDAPYLFHVINGSLNDVGGPRAEWRERKALSFTFSPLHYGSHIRPEVARDADDLLTGGEAAKSASSRGRRFGGYRSLRDDGRPHARLKLGTAMAISGAAASPNMGQYTSAPASFLLSILNVRLGWWMRAPWTRRPDLRLGRGLLKAWRALLSEALGRTSHRDSVVYLSDGGHFDNLGLYEMIRRHCRYIVVVDASCDGAGKCTALGDALRKIRIDFGIPIDMHAFNLGDDTFASGRHAHYGTIRYSKVNKKWQDGVLIYIKPVMGADLPIDVQAYQRDRHRFPHESTVDQWFSESQFESYRKLGEHSVGKLMRYYRKWKGPAARLGEDAETSDVRRLTHEKQHADDTVRRFCYAMKEAVREIELPRQDSSTHAGGVIYRRRGSGLEFLLVDSLDHSVWVLPKGRIEHDDLDSSAAAEREVREETGYHGLLIAAVLGVFDFPKGAERFSCTYFLMECPPEATWTEPIERRERHWLTIKQCREAEQVPPDILRVLARAIRVLEPPR